MPSGVPQNEPKTTQNGPKRAQDDPKRGQRRPKTTPRGTRWAPKSDPEAQDEKRTEPRRSQDRLGPPQGRLPQVQRPPREPFGSPKRHQNRLQNDQKWKRKINRQKSHPRRSWTRLGAILGRSWPHLEANFGPKPLENVMFRDKSLFRR